MPSKPGSRRIPGLDVERVGLNIVARTSLGRERRVVMAGHLDTVPANNNAVPRIEGDVLHGLGAADMKSGVAVLLRLAEEVTGDSRFDCTFVFYEAEEIADEHNGLRKLFADRPDLVAGDFAVLLEPTDLWMEAGCQGSIRLEATFHGRRAHTARPWQGDNAIDRAAPDAAALGRLSTGTAGGRRTHVPPGAVGRQRPRRRGRQRRPRPLHRGRQPPLRPFAHAWRRRRPKCGRCSTAPTRSS